MPKKEIDYSNTIIYKIICKNSNIKDIYVGHTTNFVQRKYAHKQNSYNKKSLNYMSKLYKTIRENGGWNNWNMIMVDFFKCNNSEEARKKEQEYYEKLNANLNGIEPFVEKKNYYCNKCKIYTNTQKQLDTHYKTLKHINQITKYTETPCVKNIFHKNDDEPSQMTYLEPAWRKLAWNCETCDFNCSNKYNFNKHLVTKKHKLLTNADPNIVKNANKSYVCECGIEYKHRQSLHTHKKKCRLINNTTNINTDKNDEINYKELILKLMNENKELQKTILDLIPKIGNTNCNNNINQKININMFLNDKCKDAMTIEHFMNTIIVTMSNVFLTKNKGIDEGISNIFIENINKLSLHERPIHCTDVKRDTVYIKSDGKNGSDAKWAKDTDNEKFKNAIKKVEYKQHKNLGVWMDAHPGWEEDSKLQDEYLDIMRSCTKDVKEQKIIKKVCNVVTID